MPDSTEENTTEQQIEAARNRAIWPGNKTTAVTCTALRPSDCLAVRGPSTLSASTTREGPVVIQRWLYEKGDSAKVHPSPSQMLLRTPSLDPDGYEKRPFFPDPTNGFPVTKNGGASDGKTCAIIRGSDPELLRIEHVLFKLF